MKHFRFKWLRAITYNDSVLLNSLRRKEKASFQASRRYSGRRPKGQILQPRSSATSGIKIKGIMNCLRGVICPLNENSTSVINFRPMLIQSKVKGAYKLNHALGGRIRKSPYYRRWNYLAQWGSGNLVSHSRSCFCGNENKLSIISRACECLLDRDSRSFGC